MWNAGRLMLRRALTITLIAVAASAAGALAFAPNLSRVSRAWSHGIAWSGRAFTPVPVPRDSSAASHDPTLANDAVPGTYCPIRPRDPNMSVAMPDARTSSYATPTSASTPVPGKTDLLAPSAPAMCNPSADTAHATPAPHPLLP
jgi:hypothetical protein